VTIHERLWREPRHQSPTRQVRSTTPGAAARGNGRGATAGRTPADGSPSTLSPRHLAYLRDVASHPYVPALDRDRRLGLSRGQGVRIRRHLTECGLVSSQRVSTGRRAGQVLLLSLTAIGAKELEGAGVPADVIDSHDVRRGFYLHRLRAFASRTWPGATVSDRPSASASQAIGLVVRIPDDIGGKPARSVAFQVISEETTRLQALLSELTCFEEAYLWTKSPRGAHVLQQQLARYLPASEAARMKCLPIAACFPVTDANKPPRPARKRSRTRRRRPQTLIVREFIRAYGCLHDLDRLQESPLVELESVRERVNPLSAMAEAKALRAMLVEAATRAANDLAAVPTQAHVRHFLEQYLRGKGVSEIAAELGVSREWCSRGYRTQAFALAALQCERFVGIAVRRRGAGQVGGS